MQENTGFPVLINLSALSSYNGVPGDPAQLVTTGRLIPAKDGALLTYHEVLQDEAGEPSEAEVEMVLRKDQITLNRVGDFSSTMHFRKNHRFETRYRTPYGEMNMSLMTREARWTRKPGAGTVHLHYDVSMSGDYAATNEIHLEYWRKDNGSAQQAER
ncbi:MAG: DUF1934 domain-containing protein [Clostridia bacterium]|nr:DUF1934 domain-containing protein [Clostridia bacterium]